MAFYAFGDKDAVNPEAVQTSLLEGDDWVFNTRPIACLAPEIGKRSKQAFQIMGINNVLRKLVPAAGRHRRDQPF
jgi:hypothetical protein